MRRQKVEDCKELAHKAGQWISFDPDRYGEGLLDSMEAELQVFLGKLPEDYRNALYLVYIEDMSYEDAGRVMGKNRKQIENLVFRAKAAARKELVKEGVYGEERK